MQHDKDTEQSNGRTIKGVSLFPEHLRIVETFAKCERRNFSNAVQVIIEQWAAQHPKYDQERSEAA